MQNVFGACTAGLDDSAEFLNAKSRRRLENFGGNGQVNLWRLAMVMLLGAVLVGLPARVASQAVNGNVVGTVTDSSGAVVAGAKVTITETQENVSRTATSNESGFYSFPDVPPGVYKVTVEKQGFKTVVRSDVHLSVSTTARVDLTLQPGPVSETINVEVTLPPLQTDSAQTGAQLSTSQAEDLPVNNGRNFQNLVNLIPGATRAENNHSVFFNPQGSRNNEVNGTSSLSNNFQIEGVNDNERTGLLQVYVPPIEAIQEVQVLTSNYDAEQGTALGAVVNVIYKSGTNDFHGAAYEFYNGSALNAKGFFDRGPNGTPFQKPHSAYNYWGGNLGGPIFKGKTFFFVDYLRTTNHSAQFQRLSVPTAAERNGDFSDPALTQVFDPLTGDRADCLPGGNAKLCGTGRTQFVASSSSASPNYNPACTAATPGFNNGNCPNVIPINRLDPITAKLLALVPLPNNNQTAAGTGKYAQNFLETSPFRQDNNSFDVKIDHYQGKNDHIAGHLGYMNPITFQGPAYGLAGGPIGGGFQGTGTDKTFSAAVNWDHIFSPSFVVQNRVGLNRYHNTAQQNDYGTNASTAIGIPGVNVGPFESGLTGIFVDATISNPMVGYSASLPWVRAETDLDIVSNWNKVIGNHTIKWGGNLIRLRDDLLQEQTFSPRGAWHFGASQTGLNAAGAPKVGFANNFASFFLGFPSQVGRDLAVVFPAYREWQVFGYVNDKWQLMTKLTLNLGVRWEFYPPGTPHFPGGFSNYDPTTNNLVVAGVGGNPLDLGMQRNYKDFAPRIGVAYQLTSKDVIRAGYGISYEPFVDNTYAYDFPVKQNNAFNNVSGFGPAILPSGTAANFAAGFPAPLTAAIPSNGIIPANIPLLINQSYDVINLKYHDPYIQSWNLTYERVLPLKLTVDVSYVGNRGVHAPIQYDLNAVSNPAMLGAGSAGQPLIGFCVPGTTTCRTASTTLRFAGASSDYNALQVKLDRRISNGLALTTSYTYGKALGFVEENGENSNGIDYYINFRRNYARTDFDRRHVFVQSYIWDLPFGKGQRWLQGGGPLNYVFGGWRFSSVVTFMTGAPSNFGCTCASINTPGNHQSPWVTGPIAEPKGVDTQLWFDTSVFQDPTKLFGKPTFGNVGRYTLSGPNFFNLDSSLAKTFRLTERFNFEFRTDWFSATNTAQFNNPNVTLGDANFGHVTGAGGARNVYFGGRLIF
ncbi:MAG TPA: carboxypeptidase regulatory-like domain-containing protein [Candidatus Acidoferrum sp.]|nr:carboxypeptidase regulatory-like domain-containing protein [Candidatus Acidoferrum sp.]